MCCMALATDSTSIIADPIPWNYSSRERYGQQGNLASPRLSTGGFRLPLPGPGWWAPRVVTLIRS